MKLKSELFTAVNYCMFFSLQNGRCKDGERKKYKLEPAKSVGKVCSAQVFGHEPLYPGKRFSLKAPYHGKRILCPGMALDGIVPNMHEYELRVHCKTIANKIVFFFPLNTNTGIQQHCGIPQCSKQLLHSMPRVMHNGLTGGNNSQIRTMW